MTCLINRTEPRVEGCIPSSLLKVKTKRINNGKERNVALFLCNAFEGLIRKP